MNLYSGVTTDFVADATHNRIADKLKTGVLPLLQIRTLAERGYVMAELAARDVGCDRGRVAR